jgi:hypothetical protein
LVVSTKQLLPSNQEASMPFCKEHSQWNNRCFLVVSNDIFPQVSIGFSDTVPAIREQVPQSHSILLFFYYSFIIFILIILIIIVIIIIIITSVAPTIFYGLLLLLPELFLLN